MSNLSPPTRNYQKASSILEGKKKKTKDGASSRSNKIFENERNKEYEKSNFSQKNSIVNVKKNKKRENIPTIVIETEEQELNGQDRLSTRPKLEGNPQVNPGTASEFQRRRQKQRKALRIPPPMTKATL